MAEDSAPQQLTVILDTNPVAWESSPWTLDRTTEAVLAFLNAFAMLHNRNQLAVFASHLTKARCLFPPTPAASAGIDRHHLATSVCDGVKALVAEEQQAPGEQASTVGGEDPGSAVSAAVALALCHIHRVTQNHPETESRILIVQVAPDEPGQHIAMMNCLFTAQHIGTTIDTCVLASADSVFLQQASFLTDGIYYKPSAPPRSDTDPVLLQYLLTVFLPGKAARKHLQLPQQESVDMRATCFITQEMIDEGYVCSVCLSVFSEEQAQCRTCGTRFAFRKKPAGAAT